MNRNISIQVKAAFLLTVFTLNTVVGFACSMGADMGFNTTHHEDDKKRVSVHIHPGGKKHDHHGEEADEVSANIAVSNKTHHHDAEEQLQDKKDASESDDCCHDKVVKISQTDKVVSNSSTLIHPVFFTALVSAYGIVYVSYNSQITTSIKYFVRGHHPPIPDIRIAIQSFQI